MKETVISVGSNYMDFVHKLHQTMVDEKFVLVYEGEVNQAITKTFTAMAETGMNEEEENTKTVRKVYHVMVECLQNMFKHADDPKTGMRMGTGSGIFIISKSEGYFAVTTGNVIATDKIDGIKERLDVYNALSPEEIKDLYKKMIRESKLSEKAGAGLGFIDIIKKTGNKVTYDFRPINEKTSFFVQRSEINRL